MPFDITVPKSSEEQGEKGAGRSYPSIACVLSVWWAIQILGSFSRTLKIFVSLNINNTVFYKEVILICCMHNKLLSATTTYMGDASKIQGRKSAKSKPSLMFVLQLLCFLSVSLDV